MLPPPPKAVLDRPLRQPESAADLGVAQPLARQPQDFGEVFAGGQPGRLAAVFQRGNVFRAEKPSQTFRQEIWPRQDI